MSEKEFDIESKVLISLEDFVIGETAKLMAENDPRKSFDTAVAVADSYKRIAVYARFFVRELNLGMFFPCDEKGNVLEYPTQRTPSQETAQKWADDIQKYQKAKGRVIFSGLFTLEDAKDCLTRCETVKDLYNLVGGVSLTKPLKEVGYEQ